MQGGWCFLFINKHCSDYHKLNACSLKKKWKKNRRRTYTGYLFMFNARWVRTVCPPWSETGSLQWKARQGLFRDGYFFSWKRGSKQIRWFWIVISAVKKEGDYVQEDGMGLRARGRDLRRWQWSCHQNDEDGLGAPASCVVRQREFFQ